MRSSLKKNKNYKGILILVVLGILIIVALNFFQNPIRNFFYLISSPLQKILWEAGDKVSDFSKSILKSRDLKIENEKLKSQLQEILAKNAILVELKKENEALRIALNLGLEKEFEFVIGQIIGKEISQDYLIIDKGFDDGILKGQTVITPEKNLIGRIDKVYKNFSKVMLISNKNSSFDAKISEVKEKELFSPSSAVTQEADITGVVRGDGNFKIFFDLIPKDKEIKKGDLVVTTAVAGIFPQGLLVGEIKEIKKSDVELWQEAEISPFYNVRELKYLFIILNTKILE